MLATEEGLNHQASARVFGERFFLLKPAETGVCCFNKSTVRWVVIALGVAERKWLIHASMGLFLA